MSKRKTRSDSISSASSNSSSNSSSSGNSDSEAEIVDVDFDFFNLKPDTDFHSISNFLKKLFESDSKNTNYIEISQLTDLILKQQVGSTVKCNGIDSDPFGILTVLNLKQYKEETCVKKLIGYLLERSSKTLEFNLALRKVLDVNSRSKVGWLVSERIINMPTQIMAPLFKFLLHEMEEARERDDGEYEFDQYILLTRSFTEASSAVEEEDTHRSKKMKDAKQVFYYYEENEVLNRYATYHKSFDYREEGQQADSKRAFYDYGAESRLHVALIDARNLPAAVGAMATAYPV